VIPNNGKTYVQQPREISLACSLNFPMINNDTACNIY
jgi:hypothetical protein